MNVYCFRRYQKWKQGKKAANMYTIGFANPDYPKQDLSISDEIITDFSEVNIQELKNK